MTEVVTGNPDAPTCPVCGAEPGEYCQASIVEGAIHYDNHPERAA